MDIKDLKRGDVVLFSAEKGSFISWAITYLSDAPVSHAALFYDEQEQTIIEETPPRVAVNPAAKRFQGRTITARRFSADPLPSLAPVTAAAQHYLNDEAPYADSDLYLIGMLLIYRKFTPDILQQRVITRLLKKATLALSEMLDKRKHPGQTPMVCSQFVAQCYQDAGAAYELKFRHARLEADRLDAGRSLLDQVADQVRVLDAAALDAAVNQEALPSAEALCEELHVVMEGAGQAEQTDVDATPELSRALVQFAQMHQRLQAGERDLVSEPMAALQHLHSYQALFVTPGDLLKHCLNLQTVGTLQI